MRLYDFSLFAKRREALRSAEQVENLRARLNEPGAVLELKKRVDEYMVLHRDILKKAS